MPTPEPSLSPGPAQRILSALGRPGRSQSVAGLSEALGVHPNTVRAALAELRTAGLVQRSRAAAEGRGRPSFEYSLSAAGQHAQSSGRAFREYRSLTEAFAGHLATGSPDPSGEARAVGRAWGASLAGGGAAATEDATGAASATTVQTPAERSTTDEQVIDLLADLGFGPDPDARGIALRTCPLLDLAREMPEVICQVHRGLVEGAMDHYGAPSDGVDLIPFAEVGACRLHLHREPLEAAGTAPATEAAAGLATRPTGRG